MKELGAVALSIGHSSNPQPEVNKRNLELNSFNDAADGYFPAKKLNTNIGEDNDRSHQPLISINLNFSGASLSAPLTFFGQNFSDLIAAVNNNKSV